MQNQWYTKSIAGVFEDIRSSEGGLSSRDATLRLKEYGLNKLPEAKPDGIFYIFLHQFQSSLIYILLLAGAIVFAMGEFVDGFIILFVLVFNAVVGTIQEGKAQNTLLALKKYTETKTIVVRDDLEFIIADTDVVPGDIIVLQEGEKVPADARVILSNNLKADESTLSGESVPVNKIVEPIEREYLPTPEQKNIIFKGTNILSGSGRAVVVATGVNTEIGKIAKAMTAIDAEVPLKKNVRYLSGIIVVVTIILNIVLFVAGLLSGKNIREMFVMLVSLSVSIIPEGLPVVLTLILATGVWRMSKRNALVKKLQAVEALGQAEVIAVDKTGTITKNEMVVQKVFVDNRTFEIGGIGYEPKGDVKMNGDQVDPLNHQELIFMAKNAALCAEAMVFFSKKEKKWITRGDPTEAALLVMAQKIGFHKNILERESPSMAEFPFDYHLKYRASLRKTENRKFLIVAGAPESILAISNKIWKNEKNQPLSESEKNKLTGIFEKMSEDGLRVVALGIDNNPDKDVSAEKIEKITFVGFLGMKDALRPEVPDAMARALKAGVRIVMITGDHRITAKAIATEAGIYKEGDEIVTGEELDKMSDEYLAGKIKKVSVFARVSPEHKLRIIKAFKIAKKIIAMTGDGVNDAPSLVMADLGVAMGQIGTEVAKEASDIILLDDNFGTIISVIEEGRSIYKTIKKVILYLFSTSIGEVSVIAGALFLGYPLPILPAQIIWLNFVTDGFLDVSLAMEPSENNLLSDKFKKPNKYLVDFLMAQRMFFMALPMMIGTLFVFKIFLGSDLIKAQTMALCVLAAIQWFNAWNCKSEDKSIFKTNPLSNKFLVGATAIVISLQLLAVYNPFLQKILHTVPLKGKDWLLIITVALSVVVVEEVRKLIYRLWKKHFVG